eukprot:jgi/Chlat1/1804/Chrsp135S02137
MPTTTTTTPRTFLWTRWTRQPPPAPEEAVDDEECTAAVVSNVALLSHHLVGVVLLFILVQGAAAAATGPLIHVITKKVFPYIATSAATAAARVKAARQAAKPRGQVLVKVSGGAGGVRLRHVWRAEVSLFVLRELAGGVGVAKVKWREPVEGEWLELATEDDVAHALAAVQSQYTNNSSNRRASVCLRIHVSNPNMVGDIDNQSVAAESVDGAGLSLDVDGHTNSNNDTDAKHFDAKMHRLQEMGFHDRELNEQLLARFQGDIKRVVAARELETGVLTPD